jgi:hypothetical protein
MSIVKIPKGETGKRIDRNKQEHTKGKSEPLHPGLAPQVPSAHAILQPENPSVEPWSHICTQLVPWFCLGQGPVP